MSPQNLNSFRRYGLLPPPYSVSLIESRRNSKNFPQLTSSETAFGRSPKIVSNGPSSRGLLFGTSSPPHSVLHSRLLASLQGWCLEEAALSGRYLGLSLKQQKGEVHQSCQKHLTLTREVTVTVFSSHWILTFTTFTASFSFSSLLKKDDKTVARNTL